MVDIHEDNAEELLALLEGLRQTIGDQRNDSAEIAIGLQAIAAARLASIAPELTATLLSTANGFLPDAPGAGHPFDTGGFWERNQSVAGKVHRGSLPAVLEWFGKNAINRYNQERQIGKSDIEKADVRRLTKHH